MDIIISKYGFCNVWDLYPPAECFWFFLSLCAVMVKIRPHLWIKIYNRSGISFLNDPWCFNLPMAPKPTFMNMDVEFKHLNITEFVVTDSWDN